MLAGQVSKVVTARRGYQLRLSSSCCKLFWLFHHRVRFQLQILLGKQEKLGIFHTMLKASGREAFLCSLSIHR